MKTVTGKRTLRLEFGGNWQFRSPRSDPGRHLLPVLTHRILLG